MLWGFDWQKEIILLPSGKYVILISILWSVNVDTVSKHPSTACLCNGLQVNCIQLWSENYICKLHVYCKISI
jgi:hypothetical protein